MNKANSLRGIFLSLMLAAAVVLIPGCGGGDSNSSSTSGDPTGTLTPTGTASLTCTTDTTLTAGQFTLNGTKYTDSGTSTKPNIDIAVIIGMYSISLLPNPDDSLNMNTNGVTVGDYDIAKGLLVAGGGDAGGKFNGVVYKTLPNVGSGIIKLSNVAANVGDLVRGCYNIEMPSTAASYTVTGSFAGSRLY